MLNIAENNIQDLALKALNFDFDRINRSPYEEIFRQLKPVEYKGTVYQPAFTKEYIAGVCGYQRNVEKRVNTLKKVALYLSFCVWKKKYRKNGGSFITLSLLNDIIGVHIPNRMAMSRLVNDLEKCGAIHCINSHYQFNSTESFSRLYQVNRLFILQGQELSADDLKDQDFSLKEELYQTADPRKILGTEFPLNMIRLNEKNQKISNDFLLKELYQFTFGTTLDFKTKLDYVNLEEKDFNKKQMFFNFDSKKGFSGRAYSPYIATHREENSNGDYTPTDRTLWRKENNLKYQYDIKGAVPRCLILLKTGRWLDSSIDPYQLIWDQYCQLIQAEVEFNRPLMKNLFMRCAFPKTKKLAIAYFNRMLQWSLDNQYSREDPLFKKSSQFINDIWDSIEIICGHRWMRNIFYIESYIELLVCYSLKLKGIKCYNIYDEFYYSDDRIDIQKEIELAAYKVLEKFNQFQTK